VAADKRLAGKVSPVTAPVNSSARMMTHDEALAWIAEMFEEPTANIVSSRRRSDIPAWDSLGQLLLMSALDQQFGIRLTPGELSSLASVQDILNILGQHQRLIAR
jgi:acyl carrier protein